MNELGEQLKALRRAQKITLKELAQRSGVHWVTLSRFENGYSDLGARKLARVAQALGQKLEMHSATQGYTLDDLAKGYLRNSDHSISAPLRPRGIKK